MDGQIGHQTGACGLCISRTPILKSRCPHRTVTSSGFHLSQRCLIGQKERYDKIRIRPIPRHAMSACQRDTHGVTGGETLSLTSSWRHIFSSTEPVKLAEYEKREPLKGLAVYRMHCIMRVCHFIFWEACRVSRVKVGWGGDG